MATWCPSCAKHLPLQKRLAAGTAAEGVEFIAVPVDETDDEPKLKTYLAEKDPPYRLLSTLSGAQRAAFAAELARHLGHDPALPSTLITDAAGRVIDVVQGVPTLSQLRRWLEAEM